MSNELPTKLIIQISRFKQLLGLSRLECHVLARKWLKEPKNHTQ